MVYSCVLAPIRVIIKEEFKPVLEKWAMYPTKYHMQQLAMKK